MKNKTGIYRIINKINNYVYYGSAADCFRTRWNEHKSALRGGYHSNFHLQNAWNKYGANSFSFEIILLCNAANCLYYEQLFLDKYWDKCNKCYNINPTAGNLLGFKHTFETKQKISESRKGITGSKHHQFGKPRTKKVKRKIRKALTGTERPESTCKKIRQTLRSKMHPNAKLNRKLVAEIREKYKNGGFTHRTLAREYGVSRAVIADLLTNKSWVV